jgi:hypothetical protein
VGTAQDHRVVDTFTSDRSDHSPTKAFCQGEPGAMGLSRMPIARNRRAKRRGDLLDHSILKCARTKQ